MHWLVFTAHFAYDRQLVEKGSKYQPSLSFNGPCRSLCPPIHQNPPFHPILSSLRSSFLLTRFFHPSIRLSYLSNLFIYPAFQTSWPHCFPGLSVYPAILSTQSFHLLDHTAYLVIRSTRPFSQQSLSIYPIISSILSFRVPFYFVCAIILFP